MSPFRGVLAIGLGAAVIAACGTSRRAPEANGTDASSGSTGSVIVTHANVSAEPGVPRPGMAWIPPGTLHAGTPRDRAPRVADEEMPGDAVQMGGFYMDLLPYPNEPGAIPTSNVTREEASALCNAKGKRLCSELEWERACKGADNVTYEYGDAYREQPCKTGATGEESAKRPSGDHAQCKSSFGVADLHGGVWQWTSSDWVRGPRATKDANLGVLRGGNAVAGELVGRCANAIGRSSKKKSDTMGLRCCAGPKNAAEVELELKGTPGIAAVKSVDDLKSSFHDVLAQRPGTAAGSLRRAFTWTPTANEELEVLLGCNKNASPPTCSLIVGRIEDGKPRVLATTDVALRDGIPDVVRLSDARHLRLRGLDALGTFGRDITYVYGRVEIDEPKRP